MKLSKTILVSKLQKLYRKAAHEQLTDNAAESIFPDLPKISRKKFIRNTGLASASLLIPDFLGAITRSESNAPKPVVAIIGAGIAGLHACHILAKQEGRFDIMLYEGSKRTGGRIFTAKNLLADNITTELGGEFVDSTHTDMLSLIDEFGLETYDCKKDIEENSFPEHTYFFGGQVREEREIIDELKNIIPRLQADKLRIKDETEVIKLDKLSLAIYLQQLKLQKWFYDLIYWAFTAEFGLDASQLSCVNFIDMVGLDTGEHFEIFGDSDERFKIKGGNQSLTDAMTVKLAAHIRYSHKLTAISKTGSKLKLTFENGRTTLADYVLLAIPFSVLRSVKIDPAIRIPDNKQAMISAMQYGTNSKLLLGFNERIWRNQRSSGYLINETIQNGWDNSQMQNDNKGSGGFTVFLGGKQGRELKEDDIVATKYLDKLELAFHGVKGVHNKKRRVFNWSKYPFTLGSYACYKTGQWSVFDPAEMMKPVGNLFFAGEHCSDKFQGFMNGGAETGRMAAEGIIKAIEEKGISLFLPENTNESVA